MVLVSIGIAKGDQVLSDINIIMALVLIVFVLLAGPTVFILKMWTNSLGLLGMNFFRMAFWMDPIAKRVPEGWTVSIGHGGLLMPMMGYSCCSYF